MKKNILFLLFFLFGFCTFIAQGHKELSVAENSVVNSELLTGSFSDFTPREAVWGNLYMQNGKIFIYAPVKMNLVEVYDLNGCLHVVKERLSSDSAQIPFTRPGDYVVRITAEDGAVVTRKIRI